MTPDQIPPFRLIGMPIGMRWRRIVRTLGTTRNYVMTITCSGGSSFCCGIA